MSSCFQLLNHISIDSDGTTKNIKASGVLTGKQLHLTQTLAPIEKNRGKCGIAPITFDKSWNDDGDFAFITDSEKYTKGYYFLENEDDKDQQNLSCEDKPE